MKNKDSISLTLTANGGFILDVPDEIVGKFVYGSGAHCYKDIEGLLAKLIDIVNQTRGPYSYSRKEITKFSLTYKGDDDDEM